MLRGVPFWAVSAMIVGIIVLLFVAVPRLLRRYDVEPAYTQEQVEASKATGDRIAAAIVRYRSDHKGQPPWRLDTLVPSYLPEIPRSSMPSPAWGYEVGDEDRTKCVLWFEVTPRRSHRWYTEGEPGVWRELVP